MKKWSSIKEAQWMGWALAGLAFLFTCKTVTDLDFWWHLAAGRWMVENRSFISIDPGLSFTFSNAPWTDLTWGFEILIYKLYTLVQGISFITLFFALLSAITILLGWKTFQRLAGVTNSNQNSIAFLVFLGALTVIELRWINRPEQLTYFCGMAMLFLLVDDRKRHEENVESSNKLWLLPLIQLLWVNTHGLFWLGITLPGLFFISKIENLSSLKVRIKTDRLFRIILATVGVCLLNPRGWVGMLFPLHLWSVLNHPFYHHTIPEATNPLVGSNWGWDSWGLVVFGSLVIGSFFVTFTKKSLASRIKEYGIGYWLLAGLLMWFSILARRNVILFVLWTLPWVAHSVMRLITELVQAKYFDEIKPVRVAVVAGAALALSLISNYYRSEYDPARFGAERAQSIHPVKAAEFLRTFSTKPRLFAGVHFADYMLFEVPGYRSYIDGRFAELYPREHFQHYMDILAHPPLIEAEVASLGLDGVGVTLSTRMELGLIRYLATRPDWKVAFYDETSVIYLKESSWKKLNHPLSLEQLTQQAINHIENLEQNRNSFLDGISLRRTQEKSFALSHLAEVQLLLGHTELSKSTISEVLKRSPNFYLASILQCVADYSLLEERMARGNSKREKKFDLAHAVQGVEWACQNAIRQSKADVSPRFILGLLYLNTGRALEAIQYFEKVQHADPLNFDNALSLARSYASVQDFSRAERSYKEAARLRPYNPQPLLELANLLKWAGQPDRAKSLFEEVRRRQARLETGPNRG